VGKTLHEVFPKEKADFFLAHIHQALTEERMHRVEYKLQIDQTEVGFEGCVSPLSTDSVVWIGRDITERKQSEEKLRESEQLYHTTFNNAPVGIAHTDLNGRWRHVNQRLCDILGYSREELLECNFQDVTYPEDVAADELARRQFLAGEIQRYSREKRYVRRDGLVVWVNVIVTLQRSPAGEPKFFITVVQDITERKQLEQQFLQSQKMEAVGQLAGGIAHDFNNLLTVITGYSELSLARLPADDRLRRNLEEIKKAGDRAASLTRQLLAFSRKQMLQPKVLNLNLVVSDLEKMLRRLIGENIELRTVLDSDLGSVKADPGQIEQVVMNLVVNARDAMPHGGKVTIETVNVYLDEAYVKHHVAVRSGAYVMLAISDNGCGMTAETKARMFEPFFTTKESGKGTGLGLSTVYGIVKQSGGNIWAYSESRRVRPSGCTCRGLAKTLKTTSDGPSLNERPEALRRSFWLKTTKQSAS
jgi:PAS domain S-box-containing protein